MTRVIYTARFVGIHQDSYIHIKIRIYTSRLPCFHNSLVDCTKEAAVHQHGEKNSPQLFFNIASWSYFYCHGSLNTAKQGGDGFLICCHFSIAVWKHDNRSSGHAFLYVWTARILILKYCCESCCVYTNLDVYIQILLYIYESWCIYTNLDVFIRILMCIYESLTIILRNRAEYHLILSRRGRRPHRLKSDDITQDWAG